MPKLRLDRLHPLTHPSRIWQAQLAPPAPPRPPPPPPEKLGEEWAPPRPPPPPTEKLDEEWAADRLRQTGQLLGWMADGPLSGGVKFLSVAHGEDTRAKADELLKKV